MSPLFASSLARLDAAYHARPFFEGVRARLLAAFSLFLLVGIPIHIAYLLWVQPFLFSFRIGANLAAAASTLYALRLLFRGRLALAGSIVSIVPVFIAHFMALLTVLSVPPLSFGFRVFALDVVFLLGALIFASRRVALGLFGFTLVCHAVYYRLAAHSAVADPRETAAAVFLRDGVIALSCVFALGVTVIYLIAASHRRSDESLRASRAVADNLETLVAQRTLELGGLNEELLNVNAELITLNRDLTSVNDDKNAFLGMAAHDLRNPIVKIRMIADMIEADADYSPVRLRADLATISATSTGVLGLLTDLLDVNAIEEGQIRFQLAPLDASALLREVHAEFRARAAVKGLHLILVPADPKPQTPNPSPVPPPVLADPAALRRILVNLVSNALKFSRPGQRIWLSTEPAPGDRIRFSVRDEGPGLSEKDRGKLFGKYSRLSAQPTGGETSHGLGLSIVKRLVVGMAGTITVDSTPGHGATFRVELPAAPAGEALASPSPVPRHTLTPA